MARITIKDLPVNMKISKTEMKATLGGITMKPSRMVFAGDDEDCELEEELFFAPSEIGKCDD